MTGAKQNPNDPNPYRAPGQFDEHLAPTEHLGEPTEKLEVVDLLAGKQPWTVSVYADRLRFAGPDEPGHDVMRGELSQTTSRYDTWFIRRSLEVRATKKRMFQFSPDDFEILKQWMGPPTSLDLRMALKKRFSYVLPIAILIVVTSLPLSGDPDAGIEPLPFDAISCLLGLSLFLIAGISRFVPHRSFFLLDSLWFTGLAATLIYQVATGSSWLWIILVVIQIQLVVSGIQEYIRFSALEPEIVSATLAENSEQPQGPAAPDQLH